MSRVFLFLQGPPGTAFSDLGEALVQRGHVARRINFNGGDRLSWRGESLDFRGRAADWPSFFADALQGATDIVLFGDCRPLHRTALQIAEACGVRAHVFEEGYLRPDWVTLELGGVNARSRLPRSPEWYRRTAQDAGPVAARPALTYAFASRLRLTAAYYFACAAMKPLYPFYRTHRPTHPVLEAFGWLRKFAGRRRAESRSWRSLAGLAGQRYVLLPLQLDSDAQIRVHSPFASMADALDQVIASFAADSPKDLKLLVKAHPLDNGLRDWRAVTEAAARRHGAEGRIVFTEVGDIERMVSAAAGVITVNSTTGALALAAGKPTKTLGQAIYDLPGLTDQGPLRQFWLQPTPPDAGLYEDFRRVLAACCLVPGGFFAPEAVAMLVEHAVERLVAPPALTAHADGDSLSMAAA